MSTNTKQKIDGMTTLQKLQTFNFIGLQVLNLLRLLNITCALEKYSFLREHYKLSS
jgi:hypothetical protein